MLRAGSTVKSRHQMARVYKFLPRKWALDDIKKQRIKISGICDLNDPFELIPFVLTSSKHRQQLVDARRALSALGRGMLCFSFKWSNPVLWAHYADKHKGICLGFDVPAEYARKVVYVDTRQPFPTESNDQIAQDWIFTKFSGWRYEEECRIYAKLEQEENGHYFADLKENTMTLREVILGSDCPVDFTTIRELVEPYGEEVRVIKARPSDESFDMIETQASSVSSNLRPPGGSTSGGPGNPERDGPRGWQ